MKVAQVFFQIIVLSLISFKSLAIDNDSIKVDLRMPIHQIQSNKDIMINLKVTSYQKRILEVPEEGVWGYMGRPTGFIAVQVQRKIGPKYAELAPGANIDNFQGVKIDTLNMNDAKAYSLNVNMLYHFLKGEYRVRVLVKFSSLNPIKDIYSKWVYFQCKKEL